MDDNTGAARNAAAITPHATNALSPTPRAIYVGGAGDITLRSRDGNADVVFVAVPAGTILPVMAQFVRAAGTTATALVAMY